jgi:adenine/guanine/hypoxanthine permease
MADMLERVFRLSENRTTVGTELVAGTTTFLTMAYIIFVQPAVLSGRLFGFDTGMDFGAVTTATCLSAALATAIMALYARYPIAQAPGMGENFFFVFSAIPAAKAAGFGNGWEVALGCVLISGLVFLGLSLAGLREMIFNAVSASLKNGIAVGIGLFIAFIGFQNAGFIVKDPGTAVKMNAQVLSPDLLVFFCGPVADGSVARPAHARFHSVGNRRRDVAGGGIEADGAAASGGDLAVEARGRVDVDGAIQLGAGVGCDATFAGAYVVQI